MRIAVFSTKQHDRDYLTEGNRAFGFDFEFLETRLDHTTIGLVQPYDVVSVFVNDIVDKQVLDTLKSHHINHVALRCAGFNNVDLNYAKSLGIAVSRVPAYSPEAVAEHTVALMMTLNRKTHKAYNRVKENNFSLRGLLGFNFHGKTAGIIGTGKIGSSVIKILQGLGCSILCYDPQPSQSLCDAGAEYVDMPSLLQRSDIISLHCPLFESNRHLIDSHAITLMKHGVMLINTSRGGLVDSDAIIHGLKSKKIGYLGLDVYEMESELFFEDLSTEIVQDDTFTRLAGFPNVLITGHQGFFTHEALTQIAATTLNNIHQFSQGKTNPEGFL